MFPCDETAVLRKCCVFTIVGLASNIEFNPPPPPKPTAVASAKAMVLLFWIPCFMVVYYALKV